jgi:hypothetical protein
MSPRRNSKLKFLPELRKHYLNKQSSKEKLQLSINEQQKEAGVRLRILHELAKYPQIKLT